MKYVLINKLLLIATIILTIFIIIVLVFYWFEMNIDMQQYLPNVQSSVNRMENNYTSLMNKNPDITNKKGVIVINNFLNTKFFNSIKQQFEGEKFASRNFLFRKASGINFFKLHQEKYEGLLEIYYSNKILSGLSSIIGKPVQRISLADPNACSLLMYTNEGDHIDWHLDYSSYYGDRYVVLLTIVNENKSKTDLSNNTFEYIYNGKKEKLKMNENSLLIFKGSDILHQSTSVKKDERRILLSMVYCDICQEKKNVFNQIYEKTKNFIIYN